MSYASLIAEASHYSPAQEAAGILFDVVGSSNWSPQFTPVYRQAGPTAWLPFSVKLVAVNWDAFTQPVPADLLGSRNFSFAMWWRRNLLNAPQEFMFVDNVNGFWQLVPGTAIYRLQFGTTLDNGAVNDTDWHLISWGMRSSDNRQFLQIDNVRTESVASTWTGWSASTIGIGQPGQALDADIAGLLWFPRYLLQSELVDLQNGPSAPVVVGGVPRYRRSGKIRAVRR